MDHVKHPFNFGDISIFNFSWVFKGCFNKRGQNFDHVSKNGYLRSS